VDAASVRVSEGSATLWATVDGGALLELDEPVRGRIEYRTGAAVETWSGPTGPWPVLPPAAAAIADSVAGLDAEKAAETACDWVRRRVAYDTSEDTAARHLAAAADGHGFAERCLVVGAGDCDVQNAFLAAVLHRAGLSVRMAVGVAGTGGRAVPGLHAWVEYRGRDGRWRAVDASQDSLGGVSQTAGIGPSVAPPRVVAPAEWSPHIRRPLSRPLLVSLLSLFGLVAAVAVLLRPSVDVRWGGAPELADLLRGALARPEAFRDVPALFTRRIVPLIGSRTISLNRARSLAGRGRLAVGSAKSDFVRKVVVAGGPVIDADRADGRAVAAALGAVDLDRWGTMLARGTRHPVTEALERAVATLGERWDVALVDGTVDDADLLDGRMAGLGRRRRLVALDRSGGPWRHVAAVADSRPSAATLLLAEHLVEHLPWSPERGRRLLSLLASAAIDEWLEERQ
jgi:transglutaminase-like putative cysteine protease